MISTFSGVGMQERGIENTGLFDLEVIATSEIDKDAILSYAAIHCGLTPEVVSEYPDYPPLEEMVSELKEKNIGFDPKKNKGFDWDKRAARKETEIKKYWLALHLMKNLGDIGRVQELPYCDLLTFSFPCQSISVAGRQEGIVEHETRSGLVYEIVRLIRVAKENNTLPKYLLLENVAALVSKKFIGDFNNLNSFFDDAGYNVYWQILDGKDCGIPQSRKRVFAIYIRKDIDNGKFEFPKPFDSGLRLKDVLEENVDEKYYLSDDKINTFVSLRSEASEPVTTRNNDYASCLRASYYKNGNRNVEENIKCGGGVTKESSSHIPSNELEQVGHINGCNSAANRVYSNDCARTLVSEAGGGGAKTGWYLTQDDIARTVCGGAKLARPSCMGHCADKVGYLEKGTGEHQSNAVYNANALARTLQASDYKDPMKVMVNTNGEM